MKKNIKVLQPTLMIGIGIFLAIAAASLPSFIDPKPSAVALRQIITPTPTPHAVSQIGSTTGITLMGFVIVMIVVLPILLRRQFWVK